ncbi:hypothetical protein MNEG_6002 [Monoraphidium neglectum]|uniref:Peptidase C1A papain C-terminal domain-containing protein n=1 Tax=Monoraphidium neglectum TaxID=145388 RepID=A0A0D2MN15_9CHLO|nr:hypothetical protein MNEG_6002 [Monoraphidium neglectum]KIZ01957.1 hypothetical protein MNEG_6002 [Monoraphidium neglectum]|eukprot:XP_013900976.1 hypothetical protein MNEG_6002 [Monoraphidium neglectum]
MQQAQALLAMWKPALRGACKGDSSSLCGSASFGSEQARDALLLATSPTAFDGRLSRGAAGKSSVISPPGDQGDCSACVSFAVTAAAEAAMGSALLDAGAGGGVPRLSPLDLFFCGGDAGDASCQSGWTLSGALTELTKRKQLQSADCLPFSNTQSAPLPRLCTPRCSSPVSPKGSFSWTKVRPLRSIPRMQQHIREWGGVVTRMDVPKGFRSWFQGANKTKVYDEGA